MENTIINICNCSLGVCKKLIVDYVNKPVKDYANESTLRLRYWINSMQRHCLGHGPKGALACIKP